jgi:hypothetical protein
MQPEHKRDWDYIHLSNTKKKKTKNKILALSLLFEGSLKSD